MADVTSSLIGISINAINSWPAAAIRFPGCLPPWQETEPIQHAYARQLPVLRRLPGGASATQNSSTGKITPILPTEDHLSVFRR